MERERERERVKERGRERERGFISLCMYTYYIHSLLWATYVHNYYNSAFLGML